MAGTTATATPAKQARGQRRVRAILTAAQTILATEGYAALTLRRVAAELDISLGNLTYYYSTKSRLLEAVIADLLRQYHAALEDAESRFPDDPAVRFSAYLDYLIRDCQRPRQQAVFFQIWGLATHDAVVRRLRTQIYRSFRLSIEALLRPLLPSVDGEELAERAAMVMAQIEGMHVLYSVGRRTLGVGKRFDDNLRDSILATATGGV